MSPKEMLMELLKQTPDEDLFEFYNSTPQHLRYLLLEEMDRRLLKAPTKH